MAASVQNITQFISIIVLVLISTIWGTNGDNGRSTCKTIQVSNTKYHPAEEGTFHQGAPGQCENDHLLWNMKERENYIYFSGEPNGWRIGAVKCRSNKAAIYSESDVASPFAVPPGEWKEWNFDTNNWEVIDLKLTCIDPGIDSIPPETIKLGSDISEGTSVGRVVTYVVIVVVIIACLSMFQRKKQKTHHIL